jgi:fatty-acyl-CoA synthase
MLGYYEDEAKTADAFRNGWLHNADLGRLHEQGCLQENVASREIEEVLFAHPQLAEAGVFGVPDPRWIEAVMAVVVLQPGQAL